MYNLTFKRGKTCTNTCTTTWFLKLYASILLIQFKLQVNGKNQLFSAVISLSALQVSNWSNSLSYHGIIWNSSWQINLAFSKRVLTYIYKKHLVYNFGIILLFCFLFVLMCVCACVPNGQDVKHFWTYLWYKKCYINMVLLNYYTYYKKKCFIFLPLSLSKLVCMV